MAEDQFLSTVVAHARVSTWCKHIMDHQYPARQVQAMRQLAQAIKQEEAVAEEAPTHGLAPRLTTMLSQTADDTRLEAIAGLLSALSGAYRHASRTLSIEYPQVGAVTVAEGPLGDGVGARLWGISHRFNLLLIEKQHLVEGKHVLELGSGVGSTGVTAAKLGASEVVMTDMVAPVLHTLRRTMQLNTDDTPTGKPGPPPAPGSAPDEVEAQMQDLALSDAESVSDEGELFAASADTNAHVAGSANAFQAGGSSQGATTEAWAAGNMRICYLDWHTEWCQARSSCDEAALPSDSQVLRVGADTDAQEGSVRRGGMFDQPSAGADSPPGLADRDTWPVLLACEVLYELPHAHWVAATVARRLTPGGIALVIGAVRDSAVYAAFEHQLQRRCLDYSKQPVQPERGFPGAPIGNQDIYEGGFQLYFVQHIASPADC